MSGNPSVIPTPATPDVCTFALLVEGKETPGTCEILSITVLRELNRIPSAIIHLRDGEASRSRFDASDTDLFIPGKKVEIRLGYRSNNDTVFKGIVIKQGIKVRRNGSLLVVECRDEAIKMTVSKKSRYFTETRDSDIIEALLDSYGLQKDVESTTPEVHDVVQYDSTDWDFLLCRAEANGQLVLVTDGKVRTAKPATGQDPVVGVKFGATLIELDAEIDARWQPKGITATTWSAAEQKPIDADASEPQATKNGNLSADQLAGVMGGEPRRIRHGGRIGRGELQAWADARLAMERLARVRGRAKFQGFASVTPGNILDAEGIGERYQGQLFVSGVRHSVAGGNWVTDVQFGLNPEPFAATYDLKPLGASGLVPPVGGLQVAVVTALEKDPEKEERIRVRLPIVSGKQEGAWARLATLDAGKGRGTFFRPEVNDEVVVGFLGDDPRHPIVLGMCHSSAKPAPEAAKDTNHRKGYVSRSNLKLTFDDQKKVVVLETPAGNRVTLSEADQGVKIQDQNKNSITLGTGGITLETPKDLTLKAGGDITIQGNNVSVKASGSLKASAAGSAELSGSSTSVKGSASTQVQGGIVRIN